MRNGVFVISLPKLMKLISPIDYLWLSDRTTNALVRHWILTIWDLLGIVDFLYNKKQTKDKPHWWNHSTKKKTILKDDISILWIGPKWLSEIADAIEKHSLGSIKLTESTHLPVVEQFLSYENPDNLDYYIYIKKTWKHKYDTRHIWKKVINDYLLSCYRWENIIGFNSIFSVILSSLSDLEKNIMTYRMSLLWSPGICTLAEVAKTNGLTGERVRQIEKSIDIKLSSILLDISNTSWGQTLLVGIKNQLKLLANVHLVDISFMCTDLININMCLYLLKYFLNNSYVLCPLYPDGQSFWWTTLFVSNDFLSESALKKIFYTIDKYFKKKRPEDKKILREVFISQICDTTNASVIDDPNYHKIFTAYLSFVYWISETTQGFLFPRNKKDRAYLVWKKLQTLDQPIHYSEMTKRMHDEHPELDWSDTKTLSALMNVWKNVWDGLYVHQEHVMKWWSVENLAYNYIISKWSPIYIDELEDYILLHRIIDRKTVQSALFGYKKSKFVKLPERMVGILWIHGSNQHSVDWRYGEKDGRRSKIEDKVMSILSQNMSQELTIKEIVAYIGSGLEDNSTIYAVDSALKRLIVQSKVSYFRRGIVNYYYILT